MFLGDPNLEVSRRGQLLKIKSARLGDQAQYQCSVTNTAGKQSKDFHLSVYGERAFQKSHENMTKHCSSTDLAIMIIYVVSVPPSIKGGNLTTEVTALLDTMVTLECEARGVPSPTITWHRKGEVILSSRQMQYADRGHYLKIPRVQASDAGQYVCKVTSVAGSAEKSYELDVYCKSL